MIDDLYEAAKDVVIKSGRPSISYVQRRLKVGYTQAADLIKRMEKDCIITHPDQYGGRHVVPQTDDTPPEKSDSK